jgi:hypothetical protein
MICTGESAEISWMAAFGTPAVTLKGVELLIFERGGRFLEREVGAFRREGDAVGYRSLAFASTPEPASPTEPACPEVREGLEPLRDRPRSAPFGIQGRDGASFTFRR